MANEYKSNIDLNAMSGSRKVIPDNEYLPFVPIKKTIVDMDPGDIVTWPESKLNSVRILSGRVSREMGRVYRCVKNRKAKTVDVCRFS